MFQIALQRHLDRHLRSPAPANALFLLLLLLSPLQPHILESVDLLSLNHSIFSFPHLPQSCIPNQLLSITFLFASLVYDR